MIIQNIFSGNPQLDLKQYFEIPTCKLLNIIDILGILYFN